MLQLLQLLQRLKRDERGISALEYAILAAVLVVIIVGGLTIFGGAITDLFQDAADTLGDASTAGEDNG